MRGAAWTVCFSSSSTSSVLSLQVALTLQGRAPHPLLQFLPHQLQLPREALRNCDRLHVLCKTCSENEDKILSNHAFSIKMRGENTPEVTDFGDFRLPFVIIEAHV